MASILFVHSNFPAQFRHIAGRLAAKGHKVVFLTGNAAREWNIPGVIKVGYKPLSLPETPPFTPLINCQNHAAGAGQACIELRDKGFVPDVIYGASGWGNTWFLRDIFPKARLVGFFEWYYHADSADSRFGSPKPPSLKQRVGLRLRNPVIVNDLLACDAGITPSKWQRMQFPQEFHSKITPIHDGIDTDYFSPQQEQLSIEGLPLTGEEEIVTWATRGMEPYRGFPQFIEALPAILQARKNAHIVIAGEDRICYGAPRSDGKSWKEFMLEQVSLPEDRVHFTNALPYGKYRSLLRCSNVHVYLTRPFVLSWSMLEAMSCGCVVVASDTEPVREVITDGENGIFCDFFSADSISGKVISALERQDELERMRTNARQTVIDGYDLKKMLIQQEAVLLP